MCKHLSKGICFYETYGFIYWENTILFVSLYCWFLIKFNKDLMLMLTCWHSGLNTLFIGQEDSIETDFFSLIWNISFLIESFWYCMSIRNFQWFWGIVDIWTSRYRWWCIYIETCFYLYLQCLVSNLQCISVLLHPYIQHKGDHSHSRL